MALEIGRRPRSVWWVIAAGGVACLVLPSTLSARQWPPLRQGIWEIVRTMHATGGGAPKTVPLTRCMNPADEWQRQQANLTKAGCTMTPVKQSGSTYTFSSTCNVMGVSSKTTTTIVAQGDSAYTMTVEGTTDGKPTKETATGKRTGDCTK